MTQQADLPDWAVQQTPNALAAAAFLVTPGSQDVLVSMTQPFRVWGAWLNVSIGSTSAYPAGFAYWGAKIKDSSGVDLIRLSLSCMIASFSDTDSLFLNMQGYQVFPSGGLWKVELDTDASVGNLNGRANGGIFYTVP